MALAGGAGESPQLMGWQDLSDSRILIVDDVRANIDLLVSALKNDYKLSVALDGEAALRAIEREAPDLVLLDIMMPGIDGYEVCRRIRARENGNEIPVMFLSSLEDAQDKVQGFEAGGNDYVTKPFEMVEVKARVKSLLKAKAYADAVREASERELRVAREIQMGILAQDLPARVAGTKLDVHAYIEPAKQVGGDLYEVLRVADGKVVVVIGDVMGKGVPASLFMAVTVTLLRMIVRLTQRPDEILARLNDELAAQNARRMFVTMSCVVIDAATGRTTGASAGHHALLMVPRHGAPQFVFPSSGKMLGLWPAQSFSVASRDLEAGDTLLLYTDGVPDAENIHEQQFESERIVECFKDGVPRTAQQSTSKLVEAVRTFAGGAPPTDDIAVVAVRYA